MVATARSNLQIKQVPISCLKLSEYNPRQANKKEFQDLKQSIQTFGVVDPIIVNSAPNRRNIVIGGHFRIRVCKELGFSEMPVVYVDIPKLEKEQELNLRLNKNLGQWDWDLLANFDRELLVRVGFDEVNLDRILQIDDYKEKEFGRIATANKCPKCGYEW